MSSKHCFNDKFEISPNIDISFCKCNDLNLRINKRNLFFDRKMWFQLSNTLPLIYNAGLSKKTKLKFKISGKYPYVIFSTSRGRIRIKTKYKVQEELREEDAKLLVLNSSLISHLFYCILP